MTIYMGSFQAFGPGGHKNAKTINVISTYLKEMEDGAYCSYLEMGLV
jgi:hypothetical protein